MYLHNYGTNATIKTNKQIKTTTTNKQTNKQTNNKKQNSLNKV